MAGAILGDQLDIHCGGVDNIFPHHEAEIAQTECCTGKPFVRFWLHCAHLMVEGQKMSKSLGNFYTLRDLLAKGYTGREIRYALLTVNYRLPLNFTLSGLDSARAALARIDALVERLERESATAAAGASSPTSATPLVEAFFECLDDDLNISGAMGCLFDWLRETNRLLDTERNPLHAASALGEWQRLNAVLQLEAERAAVPPEVLALVEQRNAARTAKNWAESDRLRDALTNLGWSVKDSKEGTLISPK
jgi:cysteinyl-tRNA synthetase